MIDWISAPLSGAPPTLWTTTAVVSVWAAVAVGIRLSRADRPIDRARIALEPVVARLAVLLAQLDRAATTAVIAAARLAALVLVRVVRATVATAIATSRISVRAAVVTVLTATRLTAATAVLAATALLATTLVPPAASSLDGILHVGDRQSGEAIDLEPLAERSRVLASDGSEIAVLHGEINRRTVVLEDISPLLRAAVITAEDRDFASHAGFDPWGIARAAWTNALTGEIVAGGSTITQQVAKANFTDGSRTLDRKLTELRYARALEINLSKDEILERYLNEVYVGRGAYGVAAGSEAFFGRDPAYLEAHQAALLASLIAAPERFDPDGDPERARERRNRLLAGMADEGYLEAHHAEIAAARPLDTVPRQATGSSTSTDPFVVEQVKRELLTDEALGSSVRDRIDTLFAGGLEIHTSVDWRLQKTADDLIDAAVGHLAPTAAMVLMDADTGEIMVTRSGRGFDEDQYDPALQGRRQPGSAFKAFVLATALEQGRSLHDPVDASSPAVLEFGGLRPWRVTNYAGRDLGVLPLSEAFARSSNTAFARLMLEVGQPAVEDMLERLGIDVDRALGSERGLSPAIALGGVAHGMTLPEMASAFGALTGDGRVARPHVVTTVTERDGTVLLEREPHRRRAVDADVAAQTRAAMAEVVETGTGRRAQLEGHEVVGKTGTSQLFADAWFVGETEGLVGAAWVGHPEGRVPMDRMTGGQVPAELWRDLVTATLERRTD